MAVNALVGSRLDYCNSLYRSLTVLDFVSYNVFRIVWLESLPALLSTHTSLLLGRLSSGCILNTVLYSRLPYIVVIEKALCLSLNLDKVFITPIKAKLMMCSLRSHTLPLQCISLLSILPSALLMMLKRFGMICLMMYVRSLLSNHSQRSSKPISLHKHLNFCFSWYPSMSQVNDYRSLLFLFGLFA